MPTYQYRCNNCGHQFEEFQSMIEDALTDCPQDTCQGQVERLISGGAGFLFKGSGFYETDYRSSNYKSDAAKDSPSESKQDSKSDGKSDSKVKTNSESKPKPSSSSDTKKK